MNMKQGLTLHFIVLGLIAVGFYFLLTLPSPQENSAPVNATSTQVSAAAGATSTSTPATATSSPKKAPAVSTTTEAVVKKTSPTATEMPVSAPNSSQVARVENPYSTPPLAFPDINSAARSALVNILCTSGGSVRPISGTGVIIDSKGIILTNAHVAQYVLLSQSPQVDISCTVRTGSPASAKYIPQALYIPRVWVEEHATDIRNSRPVGTGEHDYALIYIAGALSSYTMPTSFPALSPDTREAIGFIGDEVLVASYPAEFLGGQSTYNSLYPSTSLTTIGQLMTFGTRSVDVISLGGVIQAQAGSSGGAAVNAWNRMIGLITTTSEGASTGERDLRAITLGYIDRDITAQTGDNLETTLARDPKESAVAFAKGDGLALARLLVAALRQ